MDDDCCAFCGKRKPHTPDLSWKLVGYRNPETGAVEVGGIVTCPDCWRRESNLTEDQRRL